MHIQLSTSFESVVFVNFHLMFVNKQPAQRYTMISQADTASAGNDLVKSLCSPLCAGRESSITTPLVRPSSKPKKCQRPSKYYVSHLFDADSSEHCSVTATREGWCF